jgi:hypothetical protein
MSASEATFSVRDHWIRSHNFDCSLELNFSTGPSLHCNSPQEPARSNFLMLRARSSQPPQFSANLASRPPCQCTRIMGITSILVTAVPVTIICTY